MTATSRPTSHGYHHISTTQQSTRSASDASEYASACAALASLSPLATIMLMRTPPNLDSISFMLNLGRDQMYSGIKRFEVGQMQSVDRLDDIGKMIKQLWLEKLKQYHERAR